MQTPDSSEAKDERLKHFWDMKAKKYPLPFDEQGLIGATGEVLAIMKKHGIILSGKKILDIGCGPGTFALPIAREAAWVTGLDISVTMLAMFNDAIKKYGVRNVDNVRASWKELDAISSHFAKAFDIVLTAMSMAVTDWDDLIKMEQCAREWCVYIGWGKKRRDALMDEVFQAHGMRLKTPPGAATIAELLFKRNRQPNIDYIETSWDWQGTVDEAIEDLAGHIELEGYGTVPDRKIMRGIIEKYAESGVVRHTTYVEEGIIIWRSS